MSRTARKYLRDLAVVVIAAVLLWISEAVMGFDIPAEVQTTVSAVALLLYRMLRQHSGTLNRIDPP